MVNKQRVRRIKNLLYAFIILVLLLPVILMILLSFEMLKLNKEISQKLDNLGTSASQPSSPAPAASDSGYVINPDGQAGTNETPSPQTLEQKGADITASDEVLTNGATGVGEIPLVSDVSGVNGTTSLNVDGTTIDNSNVNGIVAGVNNDTGNDNINTGGAANGSSVSVNGVNENPRTGS